MGIEQLMQAVITASPQKRREIESVISGKCHHDKSTKADTRLVTISGAAKLLSIGRSTIYRLIETKRLDVIELNGCRRITMRSINAFLDGERPANEKTAEIVKKNAEKYAAVKIRKVA